MEGSPRSGVAAGRRQGLWDAESGWARPAPRTCPSSEKVLADRPSPCCPGVLVPRCSQTRAEPLPPAPAAPAPGPGTHSQPQQSPGPRGQEAPLSHVLSFLRPWGRGPRFPGAARLPFARVCGHHKDPCAPGSVDGGPTAAPPTPQASRATTGAGMGVGCPTVTREGQRPAGEDRSLPPVPAPGPPRQGPRRHVRGGGGRRAPRASTCSRSGMFGNLGHSVQGSPLHRLYSDP